MKSTINTILSILFPFEDKPARTSVFIQETWLEKVMRPTQVKDYLWHQNVNWQMEEKNS